MPPHPSIRTFGDPVLRSVCSPVERFDQSLLDRIAAMQEVMKQSGGVGLAAPQIGSLQRILVYRLPCESEEAQDSQAAFRVLVNPEWESLDQGQQPAMEGCLSLPGIQLPVIRCYAIRVTGQDHLGRPVDFQAQDLEARIIQHEVDHLDGKLILDRVDPQLRREAIMLLRQS